MQLSQHLFNRQRHIPRLNRPTARALARSPASVNKQRSYPPLVRRLLWCPLKAAKVLRLLQAQKVLILMKQIAQNPVSLQLTRASLSKRKTANLSQAVKTIRARRQVMQWNLLRNQQARLCHALRNKGNQWRQGLACAAKGLAPTKLWRHLLGLAWYQLLTLKA